jgi:hypothetical protein
VLGLDPIVEMRHVTDRASLAKFGNEVKRWVAPQYIAPARRSGSPRPQRQLFAPDEPRGACHQAGAGLGREDARKGKFRTAAQMVAMWRGLDLPGWEAPYVLRDAKNGLIRMTFE